MTNEEFLNLQNQLKQILKPSRFTHTLGVIKSAEQMAKRFNVDNEKARVAALLHDCAKNYTNRQMIAIAQAEELPLDEITLAEPQLLHGPVGAVVARQTYGIKDEAILSAIAYHTTGRENMQPLEKIIYLADFIEPGRRYPGVESLREACQEDDLDGACLMAFTNTINYINAIGGLIHPRTINARNALILKKKYQPLKGERYRESGK
jgi:predicted HD superfamily hydrolase involved in NAD metabolism